MFKENLKNLIRKETKGVSEFSQIVDISTDSIYNYQNGKRTPDIETLFVIRKKYFQVKGKRINLDWLITGEGEMFITKETPVLDKLKDEGVEPDSDGVLRIK
jgi:hypothetical protein